MQKLNKQANELLDGMETKVLGTGCLLQKYITDIKVSKELIQKHVKNIETTKDLYEKHLKECRKIAVFLASMDGNWFHSNIQKLISTGLFVGLIESPTLFLNENGEDALFKLLVESVKKVK